MAFLQNLFSRTPKVPLPTLEALLEGREVPQATPGLEGLLPDFEHLNTASDREAWADAVAVLVKEGHGLPEPWLDSLDLLMPELIPAWQADREGCFHRPVAEGLAHRIRAGERVVRPQDLRLWHVEPSELLERAVEHLRVRSAEGGFERQPSGIYRGQFADGQNAARILLPALWSNLFPGQNLFVTAPTPGLFLAAPQVLLPKLVEATQQALKVNPQDRLLGVLYQWVHGSFIPANLQDPHPMAQAQRELRQLDFMAALAAQEGDLAPELGLPAPVGILNTQQGRTYTVTTWTAGTRMLLPDADLVAFQTLDGVALGIFPQQQLRRIPELKGVPLSIWGPRRLQFEGFPSAEQLERMEAFATAEQMQAMKSTPAGGPPPRPSAPPPSAQGHARPAHLAGVPLGVQDDQA